MTMRIIDHDLEPLDPWREGVRTRMRVSAANGAAQLCQFEQWCEPGCGAPTHLHAVEEVLSVLDGEAEMWVGAERAMLARGQSLHIPAGQPHGFRNVGTGVLHVQATLAAPIFEASFEDRNEVTRRWGPSLG